MRTKLKVEVKNVSVLDFLWFVIPIMAIFGAYFGVKYAENVIGYFGIFFFVIGAFGLFYAEEQAEDAKVFTKRSAANLYVSNTCGLSAVIICASAGWYWCASGFFIAWFAQQLEEKKIKERYQREQGDL